MQVLHLTDKPAEVLLVGGSKQTAMLAEILKQNQYPFTIVLNTEFGLHGFGSFTVTDGSSHDSDDMFDSGLIPEWLLPFTNSIAESVGEIRTVPEIIIHAGVAPLDYKKNELYEVYEEFPQAIILSNGFTGTATELAAYLAEGDEPPDVVNFGFLTAPGGNLPTIELAPALTASERSLQVVQRFVRSCGFTAAEVVEDRVGLVMPRILATLINEAAFAVMEHVATPEDIDTAMKLGTNYPAGLLAWADMIGLEVIVALLDSLNEEYRQERYRTCVLLRQYVRAGWTGKSAGRGFFIYKQ